MNTKTLAIAIALAAGSAFASSVQAAPAIVTLDTVQVRPSADQIAQAEVERTSSIPTLAVVEVRPTAGLIADYRAELAANRRVTTLAAVEVRPTAEQRQALAAEQTRDRGYVATFTAAAALFGLSAVAGFALAQRVPFNPLELLWDPVQPLHLALVYLQTVEELLKLLGTALLFDQGLFIAVDIQVHQRQAQCRQLALLAQQPAIDPGLGPVQFAVVVGYARRIAAVVVASAGAVCIAGGHVAVLLQQLERVAGEFQVEQPAVRPAAAQHLGIKGVGKAHDAARLGRFAGTHMRQHLVVGQHALDQGLDRTAGLLGAVQPCLDDPGVVEDQQITGLEQRGQVAEHPVYRHGAAAIEQARGAALGSGMLGDQLGRQLEVEIAEGVAGSRSGHAIEGRTGPVPRKPAIVLHLTFVSVSC
mgnify:CR=1 FL=1